MLSINNLLKPATGQPVMRPDKDVIWGIFYMTSTIPPQGRETPSGIGHGGCTGERFGTLQDIHQ